MKLDPALSQRLAPALLCFVLALGGCALQYPAAIYEPEGEKFRFPGIHSLLNAEHKTRVLWIHGMCHHDGAWAATRMARLAELLGARYDRQAFEKPVTVPETTVQIYSGDLQVEKKGIASVQMVVWSSLTRAGKQSLCEDSLDTDQSAQVCPEPSRYPYRRASLNNMLKSDLMNTCLADAILYSGVQRDSMRVAMARAVCFALGGEYDPRFGCERGSRPDIDNAPLVLVAESLGSKMLTDAVFHLRQFPRSAREIDRALNRTRMIFLLANQIPMLDLAAPAGAASREAGKEDGLRGLVDAARPAGARLDLSDLFVVAFSDPNDILSYRLRQDYFGKREGVRVVNVVSSNGGTLLGLVEHPWDAHTGYITNPNAAAALVCGNEEPPAPCPGR